MTWKNILKAPFNVMEERQQANDIEPQVIQWAQTHIDAKLKDMISKDPNADYYRVEGGLAGRQEIDRIIEVGGGREVAESKINEILSKAFNGQCEIRYGHQNIYFIFDKDGSYLR